MIAWVSAVALLLVPLGWFGLVLLYLLVACSDSCSMLLRGGCCVVAVGLSFIWFGVDCVLVLVVFSGLVDVLRMGCY